MKRIAITVCLLVAGIVLLFRVMVSPAPEERLRKIRQLIATDPDAALTQAASFHRQAPQEHRRLLLLFEAAEAAQRPEIAADALSIFPGPTSGKLLFLQWLIRLSDSTGHFTLLETALREALQLSPGDTDLRRRLADLLLSECRRWESRAELYEIVRQRSFLLDELAMLGTTEELLEDRELLSRASRTESDRLIVEVAGARLLAYSGNHSEVVEKLTPRIHSARIESPALAELHACLGRSLVAIGRLEELEDWDSATPDALNMHPDIQYCRGWLHVQRGRNTRAAHHLAAAIRIDPNHRPALQQLGTLLAVHDRKDAAALLLERARQLDELERLLHRILMNDHQIESLQRAAELTAALGRTTETWGWYTVITAYHPQAAAQFQQHVATWQALMEAEKHQTSREVMTRIESAISDLTLTDTAPPAAELSMSPPVPDSAGPKSDSGIRFRDVAAVSGLVTTYFGGLPDDLKGLKIFEGTGGGVAVIDADADDRPDLFFTHGNTLPASDDPRSSDVFCLQRHGRYLDVSSIAIPPDRDFGQGAACGDFNNDGFDDLYIANIGFNTLLINNGDGTFSKALLPALETPEEWSTSCAIADLTMDGIPDLLHTNYAGGDVFTRVCLSGPQQLPRSCRPDLFAGTPDRLLIADGAGGVFPADPSILPEDSGRGLGVVIGDFEETGRLELFISNDMNPNALLKSIGDPAGPVRFEDQATLRGAATNGAGRIQAGMGIAAGDLTGDGLTDFLVTNFLEETNTLYAAQPGGFYSDMSARSGADAGSLAMLSFGVQPLDAELDGDLDLVILNGHVDDFSHMQTPWKMPPAAYAQTATGRYQQLPSTVLTDYGSQPALGRALARLDWNRDGRDDLIATHLDRSPALLQNESTVTGARLELVLKGTTSCRTPFGAIVRASLREPAGSQREAVIHLFAGDGYYCSNEHCISFAVRPGEVVDSLTIRWPSGLQQSLTPPPSSGRFLLIEQSSRLFELPRSK